VASTEDVVNMLADRAVQNSSSVGVAKPNDSNGNNMETSHHEYHLNEVLSLLPSLQHGMDVNPKFTSPTGVEYTSNLAAFDSLGVELVHGWLIDPNDEETLSVVGEKSYNELVEFVIGGSEAQEKVEKLNDALIQKEHELGFHENVTQSRDVCCARETNAQHDTQLLSGEENSRGSDNTSSGKETGAQKPDPGSSNEQSASDRNDCLVNEEDSDADNKTQEVPNTEDAKFTLQNEIAELREKIGTQSDLVSKSSTINDFLTSSCHQLTYHGLEQLHSHLPTDALCVFFRNNHFATLTKHNGTLYLLVTDLGYANTPEIVWEKLDAIDGDTEYANEFFNRPNVREELKPAAGPTIAPELLLAQRSQKESDHALALALSEGRATDQRMDEEEARLIAAATEASLKSYHGETGTVALDETVVPEKSQEDMDRELALAYQREQERIEHESEQLARQLQELEYSRQRQPGARVARPVAAATSAKKQDNCVVS
jgi:hypothetical protein